MEISVTFGLFLAILAIAAGAPSNDQRIVGGDPAPNAETFPYVVSIEENGNHFCAGFIYNPKYVVTTASCVESKSPSALKVVTGQVNLIELEETEHKTAVFRIILNDNFISANKTNDIALLELATEIPVDTSQDYISYNEVDTDADGVPLLGTLMGWGAVVDGGGVSPKLRSMDVELLEKTGQNCGLYQAGLFAIGTMICGSPSPADATKSPCNLDEGGPLVQEVPMGSTPIAVGILSTHSPNCDPKQPSIFTRLSVHYAWLYRTAGKQCGIAPTCDLPLQ